MLKKLKYAYDKSSNFKKSFVTLLSGNIISQLILLLSTPILTRLYSPENFGILATYSSVMVIILTLSLFSFDTSIPLIRNERLAINALFSGIVFLVIYTGSLFILLYLFAPQFFQLLNISGIIKYYWLIPITVCAAGVYQLFNYYLIRIHEFKSISISKVSQSVSQIIIQLILAIFFNNNALWLLLGDSFGRFSGSIRLMKEFRIKSKYRIRNIVNKKRIVWVIQKNKKFLIQATISGFFNTLSLQIPILFISVFYGATNSGLFMISQKIISLPIQLVSRSIGQVYYGEMADNVRNHPEKIALLYNNAIKKLFLVFILPFTILFFVAENLVVIILGEKWRVAGEFIKILTPMFFTQMCVTPLGQTLTLINKVNIMQKWEVARFVTLSITLLFINFYNFDIKIIVYSISIVFCTFYIVLHFLVNFCLNYSSGDK